MHSTAPKAIPRAKSSIKLTPPWRPIAISPDEDLVETVYIQDVEAVEHQLNQAQHQIYRVIFLTDLPPTLVQYQNDIQLTPPFEATYLVLCFQDC